MNATKNTKKCTGCGEEKPLDAFGKSKDGFLGLKSRCRVCENARARKYYQKTSTPEKSQKTVTKKEIVKTTEPRCNGQFILTLDFYDYQEVLDVLEEQARINIRTAQCQALYYVVAALKDKQENAI